MKKSTPLLDTRSMIYLDKQVAEAHLDLDKGDYTPLLDTCSIIRFNYDNQ